MSADIMASPCGVSFIIKNFSSESTGPRDMLFILKDTLSVEDENFYKTCGSIFRLFPRAFTSEVLPPKV